MHKYKDWPIESEFVGIWWPEDELHLLQPFWCSLLIKKCQPGVCITALNPFIWITHLDWVKYAHNTLPSFSTRQSLFDFLLVINLLCFPTKNMISQFPLLTSISCGHMSWTITADQASSIFLVSQFGYSLAISPSTLP